MRLLVEKLRSGERGEQLVIDRDRVVAILR
jgi:hypothetical protein